MVTLGIAILLAAGLITAKICQHFRLPSVTGYILAGLLLGPTGFGLITENNVGHNLDHFTQIALMLIAFGIGEHIEIKKLKNHAKSLVWIGVAETTGAFVVVTCSIYFTILLTSFEIANWQSRDYIALSVLLGAVSVATAPAATLLVIRELKAKGPLTSTLMAIVAIDDGLAIMIFGITMSITQHFIGQAGDPLYLAIAKGFFEIIQSIFLGLITGIGLNIVVGRMRNNAEIMTAGLAILLLCGELAIYLHLSPLLAGMTAGFTLINKAVRDVRIFRALNRFEPPIYVLFFTLAGTHLDIKALSTAGVIGLVYFLARIVGKIGGVAIGARIANAQKTVRDYLGFALVPQAGVAIGLLFLISSEPTFAIYASVITPVVLAGVFLSELIGPLSARYAVTKAGEINQTTGNSTNPVHSTKDTNGNNQQTDEEVHIIPWTWNPLLQKDNPHDVIAFGAANQKTVAGLARTATILAHYYEATPMAVRVGKPGLNSPENTFITETKEVENMGYKLITEYIPDKSIASGLVAAVEYNNAKAVVLGFPLNGETKNFQIILEKVVKHVSCPVVVVRFFGPLHTERILIPVTDMEDLAEVYQIICAFDEIGEHQIQLLYLMSSTAEENEIKGREKDIGLWLLQQQIKVSISVKAVPTESRVATITSEAEDFDIVIMGATKTRGVRKFFFGSLADAVSKELRKPLVIVYNTNKSSVSNNLKVKDKDHKNG